MSEPAACNAGTRDVRREQLGRHEGFGDRGRAEAGEQKYQQALQRFTRRASGGMFEFHGDELVRVNT